MRDAAVLVVGERRLVMLLAHPLMEGLQAVLPIIRQRGAVEQVAFPVPQRRLHRPLRQVVFRLQAAVQVVIVHHCRRPVRPVFVGIARGRLRVGSIVGHAGEAVKIIVRVFHLAAVAVLHLFEQAAAVVLVDVRGERLRAHLHRGFAAQAVVVEGIGHIRGGVAGSVVAVGLDAVIFVSVGIFVGLAAGDGLDGGDALGGVVLVFHCLPGGVGDALEGEIVVQRVRDGVAGKIIGATLTNSHSNE